MKNATRNRIRRLLLILILLGVASPVSTLSAGVGVWTSGGPYGGFIVSLAIDPTNPATLYAGTNGGVYKSTDAGGSWTAINKGLTGGVGALVIDPSHPATLYAAAGGVFKSTDGGASWTAVGTGLTAGVGILVIDPSNTDTLYAGSFGGGVFKSTNGGGAWTVVNAGLTNIRVNALAVDPSAPGTLYAGTSYSGGEDVGVFKSTNGGESWTLAQYVGGVTEVTALAVDRFSNVYAGLSTELADGVMKSTDGGATWTYSLDSPGVTVRALAIDPSAPSTLYAGTDPRLLEDLRGRGGIFKSVDGGKSWTAVNLGVLNGGVGALAIDPAHPATLYAGTAGAGIFKSSSGGGSWAAINTGLLEGDSVNALAVDPSSPATLYADAWGGGVFKSTNGGGSWSAINAGLTDPFISALAIDPSAPATLYAGTASGFSGGVFKSTDGGATWTAINAGLSDPAFPAREIGALAIDPLAPATLYAGTWAGVFKSSDGGALWREILSVPGVFALAIDPKESATLYAATGDGVFKSADGGGHWTKARTGSDVTALAIDPSALATLYAGSGGFGVFKSSDGGGTWAAANTGLTNLRVNALVIDPTTPANLYAGTDGGVFRSTDAGRTWAAFNMGLSALMPVEALALDPTGGTTLYAAGGSVWQLTAPTTGTITALLPASAHSSGVNGAFYTTDVAVANTGVLAASFTLKFLGNNQDGSNGPERSFNLDPGKSTTFHDVLGSVFNETSNFGAIRVTSNTPALDIVSVTSTPGFGGTFGQAIPAVSFADLIPAGSARSILYIREGDGFRSNLILASGSFAPTDVDVALVTPAGDWDYVRRGAALATKTYSIPPNGMTQINRVVRDMGVSGPITGARLVLSSSTPGAAFTGFASVIDETTNDPTAVLAQRSSVPGSAPYVWLLPSSAHSTGDSGAFYTTSVAVANVGAVPASFTMKFLGNNGSAGAWDYARQGTEQTFNLESGTSVIYFDVVASVFHETSAFGAIRITSDTSSLNIASVTSTSGFGGTLSQTIPAVFSSDFIPAGSSRSILYIREGDGFRSNLILASNADVFTTVDVALVSPSGTILATKSYAVPPSGMTQISRVVRDMGVSDPITGVRLVLSSSTPNAAFTAFASVIDETTNDPTAVEAK